MLSLAASLQCILCNYMPNTFILIFLSLFRGALGQVACPYENLAATEAMTIMIVLCITPTVKALKS